MSEIQNPMTIKRILLIFFVEIVSVIIVLAIFRWVPEKLLAARLASLGFLLESLLLLYLSKPNRWLASNFTFPVVLVFLLVFVIPMAGHRWFSDQNFSSMSWLGFPANDWHNWSSKYYYLVLGATAADLLGAIYRALPSRDK